jgi:hypothetical protein
MSTRTNPNDCANVTVKEHVDALLLQLHKVLHQHSKDNASIDKLQQDAMDIEAAAEQLYLNSRRVRWRHCCQHAKSLTCLALTVAALATACVITIVAVYSGR